MDTQKVLRLLELLSTNTSGHQLELTGLYKRALDENDTVKSLNSYLTEYNYYGPQGESLVSEGDRQIKRIYESPTHACELLPEVSHCIEKIKIQCDVSRGALLNPYLSMDAVSVIKKRDAISYFEALKMIANVCVYLLFLYDGPQSLEYLIWDDSIGLQRMYELINTHFIPMLNTVKNFNKYWIIYKREGISDSVFDGSSYHLEYKRKASIEAECIGLRKERLGTHSYYNAATETSKGVNVPYCWGVGNILSFMPNEALLYAQRDLVTRTNSPSVNQLWSDMPTPLECIKRLTDDKAFCISPCELTQIMNQWATGIEIEKRKNSHNCLLCNRIISGNKLVCGIHFISEM